MTRIGHHRGPHVQPQPRLPDPAIRFEFSMECLLTGIEAALRAS